ncbi:hypothetical protein MTR67_047210 [Solanum verrucosum]|uniref:F-box domain-containing protein n=1 Tax=Solanum verrucosum TaxID=315347 RepID=A0AAF0ZYD3_SOLVR|nr:hypothetical protein MTR67_047210 [Solanum verrucosum]
MDKTSAELPTEILHQILSLLPTKTAARTALLSKSWLKACSTKPHLCFDISDPIEYRAHEFLRIVDNTLESIFCCPIVEVEIVDAPKLLSFEYVNRGDSVPYLSSDNLHICLRIIEIGTCQNLRRVEFVKVTMHSEMDSSLIGVIAICDSSFFLASIYIVCNTKQRNANLCSDLN